MPFDNPRDVTIQNSVLIDVAGNVAHGSCKKGLNRTSINLLPFSDVSELEKINTSLRPIVTERTDVKFIDGTRRGLLDRIYSWVDEPNDPNIMWISGSPGSGKSSIAVKVAQELFQRR